jgi:hypothetical protein
MTDKQRNILAAFGGAIILIWVLTRGEPGPNTPIGMYGENPTELECLMISDRQQHHPGCN